MYGKAKGLKAVLGKVNKWVWISLTLFVTLLVLVLLVFKKKTSNEDKANVALAGKSEDQKNSFKSIALGLAHALGTSNDYNWWDITKYYERDKKAYLLLREITLDQFNVIASLYNTVYTDKRELRSDLLKHLDDEYLEKLSHLFPQSFKMNVADVSEYQLNDSVAKTCC